MVRGSECNDTDLSALLDRKAHIQFTDGKSKVGILKRIETNFLLIDSTDSLQLLGWGTIRSVTLLE